MSEDHRPAYVPKKYATYREYLDYRAEVNRRYSKTEKGRANTARQNASPSAQGRYLRYQQTEKYREAQERYRAKPETKAQQLAALRARRAAEPEKYAARTAVQIAVKKGFLVKPPECLCGSSKRIEAHHPNGYAPEHQLDVAWLCSKCHKREHGLGQPR